MSKSKQLPGQLDMFSVIDVAQQNDWRRRVKALKVSPAMWEILSANSIDVRTLPEPPSGYLATFDSIPVVIDDDVFSYEFELEGEEND